MNDKIPNQNALKLGKYFSPNKLTIAKKVILKTLRFKWLVHTQSLGL